MVNTHGKIGTAPWKEVWCFLVLAFGGAWLAALPLWMGGVRTTDGAFVFVSVGTMVTPALATLLTTWIFRPPDGVARSTGLVVPRPARRLLGFSAMALAYPIGVAALALPLGALAGLTHPDLLTLSGVRQLAGTRLGLNQHDPRQTVVLVTSGAALVAFVVALVPCFGEEWGWRGFLVPRLLPLGIWPALLLNGALWALWHTPLLLRGFNYDSTGLAGIAEMTVSCMLAGIILGWLDIRSGSIWPAVVAHSSNNTFAVLVTSGLGINTAIPVSPLLTQVPVWMTTALLVFVLHHAGQLTSPRRHRARAT